MADGPCLADEQVLAYSGGAADAQSHSASRADRPLSRGSAATKLQGGHPDNAEMAGRGRQGMILLRLVHLATTGTV